MERPPRRSQEPPTAPNGRERLELSLGSKSIGITAQSLIPLLVLIGGCIGFYFSFLSLKENLHTIALQQGQTQQFQQTAVPELKALVVMMMEQMKDRLQRHEDNVDQIIDAMRQLVIRHDWNMTHPDYEQLPLDVPLTKGPPSHERK